MNASKRRMVKESNERERERERERELSHLISSGAVTEV